MVNYYNKMIPKAATHTAPLNSMLMPKNAKITFTADQRQAFNNLKACVANTTRLSFPIPGARTRVVCDCSDIAMGASLEQQLGDSWSSSVANSVNREVLLRL